MARFDSPQAPVLEILDPEAPRGVIDPHNFGVAAHRVAERRGDRPREQIHAAADLEELRRFPKKRELAKDVQSGEIAGTPAERHQPDRARRGAPGTQPTGPRLSIV